jgi:hypothetical protein
LPDWRIANEACRERKAKESKAAVGEAERVLAERNNEGAALEKSERLHSATAFGTTTAFRTTA